MSAEVIHGDALQARDLWFGADAIITDPPYGIGFAAQPTDYQRAAGMKPRKWDDETPDVRWLLDIAPRVAVWGGNYFDLPISRGWLLWCKPDAPPSMGNVELCWTNTDQNAKHFLHSISATNRERCGHPTQKPLAVMARTIEYLKLPPGSLIVDPYCGSGTTGVAAIRAGHRFIGVDREADYVDMARRRIANEIAQTTLGVT